MVLGVRWFCVGTEKILFVVFFFSFGIFWHPFAKEYEDSKGKHLGIDSPFCFCA